MNSEYKTAGCYGRYGDRKLFVLPLSMDTDFCSLSIQYNHCVSYKKLKIRFIEIRESGKMRKKEEE